MEIMEHQLFSFCQNDYLEMVPEEIQGGCCFGFSLLWLKEAHRLGISSMEDSRKFSRKFRVNLYDNLQLVIHCQQVLNHFYRNNKDFFPGYKLKLMNDAARDIDLYLYHDNEEDASLLDRQYQQKYLFSLENNSLYFTLSQENLYGAHGALIGLYGGRVQKGTSWGHAMACYFFVENGEEYYQIFDPNNGVYVVPTSKLNMWITLLTVDEYPGTTKFMILRVNEYQMSSG